MSMSRNLFAGLVNSVWTALIGLAVVPLYLKYLGIEAYGLIGLFVTTQAMLQLLDMGLAQTINREVARHSASGNFKEAGKLLHILAVVYWSMAGIIALSIMVLAPLIAGHWLQPRHLPQQTIEHAVMLMGLVVACRWPIGLYQGALIGAQRLTVSSGINMLMATIGNLGAVAVLAFISPTIQAFFIWQACVGLVYAATMRRAAWRVIGRSHETRFDIDEVKRIWRFSVGMGSVAVLGLILTQLDKVILSKILTLEDFGRYTLAGVVASGLFLLIVPMFNTMYPRFSALVRQNKTEDIAKLYVQGTRLLGVILFPISLAVAFFSDDLIFVWIGNSELSANVGPIVSLLAIGTAFNGVMYFPYALQLAYGMTRLPLIIISILIVVLVPLIILLTTSYGAIGGAFAWLLLNGIYLLFGTWLTHRYLLKGLAGKWLFQDVGIPFGVSLLLMAAGRNIIITQSDWGHYARLIGGGMLALAAILLSVALSPQLRIYIAANRRKVNISTDVEKI